MSKVFRFAFLMSQWGSFFDIRRNPCLRLHIWWTQDHTIFHHIPSMNSAFQQVQDHFFVDPTKLTKDKSIDICIYHTSHYPPAVIAFRGKSHIAIQTRSYIGFAYPQINWTKEKKSENNKQKNQTLKQKTKKRETITYERQNRGIGQRFSCSVVNINILLIWALPTLPTMLDFFS